MKHRYFLFLAVPFLFCGCLLATYTTTRENFREIEETETIPATIIPNKVSDGLEVYIAPIGLKAFSYTIFEVTNTGIEELKTISAETLYEIEDGKLVLKPLKQAVFKLEGKRKGVFYIAVEIDNGSYMDEDGVYIFTKTMFTKLIEV